MHSFLVCEFLSQVEGQGPKVEPLTCEVLCDPWRPVLSPNMRTLALRSTPFPVSLS